MFDIFSSNIHNRSISIVLMFYFLNISIYTFTPNTKFIILFLLSQRNLLNLPPLQAEARLQQDIKATKTVAMTVVTYFICYVPTISFATWGQNAEEFRWFGFLAAFCTFASSTSNPIIYVLRNRRYRAALMQLVKDPCGRTPFQERPVRSGNEGPGQRSRQNNPRSDTNRLEGKKPGASVKPDENPESEAGGAVATIATSQTPRRDKVVKTAPQGNQVSSRDSSLDDEPIIVPDKQASRNGLQTKNRTKDQASIQVAWQDGKGPAEVDERKERGTCFQKKTSFRVHPTL